MKQILRIIAIFTLCAGVLCSCSKEKKYKIGISQCSTDDWREKMNGEILREIMLHEDAEVEIRSADDSNEKQIADIRYFANNGFDIIIAAPNEAAAITPVVEEVHGRGIPVVIFDRNILSDAYTTRIGADNVGMGRSAATYALHCLLPDDTTPTAIELYGLKGSSPAIGRHDGFVEAFTAGGGEIVASAHADWNYERALTVADSLLRLYPDVDLIYAHNDRMAIGAREAADRLGLHNIKIEGIDAAPQIGIKAVADSVIDATFLYPTEGHLLIQTALDILNGKEVPKEILLPVASPVDRSNADILLLQDQSLAQETAKMVQLKEKIDEYWRAHSAQKALMVVSMGTAGLLLLLLFMGLRIYWGRRRHQYELMQRNAELEAQRAEMQRMVEQEKHLNEQLQEATQSKLLFYTNVSHDLRTPLTLIAEPVEQLAQARNLTVSQHSLAQIANKNVKILRRLINQILDFRKYENDLIDLSLSEVDFTASLAEWVESFKEVCRTRDIKLTLDAPAEPLHLALDAEKIERVMFNLISNAIKYTPDNGSIRVAYHVEKGVGAGTGDESASPEQVEDQLVVTVSDTGIGIAPEDLDSVFVRFFQVDKVHPNGSGIGLSLVKAFVEMHGGEITVESEVGKGSTFTMRLPLRHVADKGEVADALYTSADVKAELETVEVAGDDASSEIPDNIPSAEGEEDKPRLLVIDDNADMRAMVRQILASEYEIYEAANGKEGLAKAARMVPDLIVSDVMMPVMDGLELTRRLKEELSTSHIPVLLLTACSMDEQRVQGYDSGADGYISKPFSGEVLTSRVRSLLANRRRIKEIYGAHPASPVVGPSDAKTKKVAGASVSQKASSVAAASVDLDNEFYQRFLEHFNREISNADLNIEQIASKMGLGHSQFYRKIKALTNYTPVELIRQLRLKRARTLLTTTGKTVSEIAYEVGFSSPAYFTKCYRAAFGETPTALRDNLAL